MKVLLFGTGKYYETFKEYFHDVEIVGLVDNDIEKVGKSKDGIEILLPENAIKRNFDKVFILVSSNFFVEVKNQLIALGVPQRKILNVYDIRKFYKGGFKNESISKAAEVICKKRGRIAILAAGLGVSGLSMSVLKVVQVLQKYYEVHVLAFANGILCSKLAEMNITVIVDQSLRIQRIDDIDWKSCYDLIFINDFIYYNLFDEVKSNIDIPIIWWIHSAATINFDVPIHRLNNISQRNIAIYGVSERVIESFKKVVPTWHMKKFCWGLQDCYSERTTDDKKIIRFVLIGMFCPLKAQNIFLDAIESLPYSKRIICEFLLIGHVGNDDFSEKIVRKSKKISNVKIMGEIDNEKLFKEVYPEISVLVCPSLDDAMPVVCGEAMMFSHPCIVSDNTGTAQCITNGKDGLIVKTGDIQDLTQKLEWMIDNVDKISKMGDAARKIYEKYFSFEQFERNLLRIVDENIMLS